MTIGIALKDKKNNRIILGSDRQATIHDIKTTIPETKYVMKEVKIVDGYGNHIDTHEIYFLFAGLGFLRDFMEHSFNIPDMQENQKNFIEYLYNDLLEDFREQLLDKKLLGTKNDMFATNSNIIIIYDNEIYELDDNLGINKVKDYSVIGSGWRIATGSLYTNLHFHNHMDYRDMVKQAIITCGVNHIHCDTNVDILIIKS